MISLQLNPKFTIGQKFIEKLYIKNNPEHMQERELFISDIKAEYSFKENKLQYIYILSIKWDDLD